MPQGGAGKCGGNLMSSGGGKKKMSTKSRSHTAKKKKEVDSGKEGDEDSASAYTIIKPSKERRAQALRAQRKAIEAEEKAAERWRRAASRAAAKATEGLAPGGEMCGFACLSDGDDEDDSGDGKGRSLGGGCGGGGAPGAAVDPREARLRYLERQSQQAAAERRTAQAAEQQVAIATTATIATVKPAPAPPLAPPEAAKHSARRAAYEKEATFQRELEAERQRDRERERREAAAIAAGGGEGRFAAGSGDDDHVDEVAEEVFLLLDMLSERLSLAAARRRPGGSGGGSSGGSDGSSGAEAVRRTHKMLCTVLKNAATRPEHKYRTLRARNDKLWHGLLVHREMVAVLSAAGFAQTAGTGAAAPGAAAAPSAAAKATAAASAAILEVSSSSSSSPSSSAAATTGAAGGGTTAADDGGGAGMLTEEAAAAAVAAPSGDAAATAAEGDLELELQMVQLALNEQLDASGEATDPGVVESLVSRLSELSLLLEGGGGGDDGGGGGGDMRAPAAPAAAVEDGHGGLVDGSDSAPWLVAGRDTEFVHPGGGCDGGGCGGDAEDVTDALTAVFAAASAWYYDEEQILAAAAREGMGRGIGGVEEYSESPAQVQARAEAELGAGHAFMCPLSGELMTDPVTTSAGSSYARRHIEAYLDRGNRTDPATGEELVGGLLVPNHALKLAVSEWWSASVDRSADS